MFRVLSPSLDRAALEPLVGLGIIGLFAAALFGVLRLGFPIWSMTVIVAAAAYIFFTIHRPIVGLIAVICVFFIPIRLDIGVSLLQAVGAGTAALLMLWFLYERRELVFGKIQIPLLILGFLVVTSLWFSVDPGRTTFYFRGWVFNMMFVMLLMNLVTNFATFKRVIWAVMIMAAANSAVGIFNYSSASDFNYRSMGLMENANSYGHLAALAFPLALYQYLYRKGRHRIAGLALAGLLLGGVVTSVSRGALLSVIVIVGVTLVRERRRAIPLLIVLALVLSATPLLPQYYQDRVGSLATDIKNSLDVGQDRGLTSRGYLNSAGLKIWWAHPVVGVGIGNFGHYYIKQEFAEELQGSDTTIAHNIYVQALAEMGLVGALVLVWLLFASGRSIWRARRVAEPGSLEWVYFGSIEMMSLAIFVSTASYGSLMNNDFWMFIGLTAVSARVALSKKKAKEFLPVKGTV